MERYTIYCTEEQTKKAFELGAPIYVFNKWNSKAIEETHYKIEHRTKLESGLYADNPTAEQMIGWLEEQGINIVIGRFFAKWAFKLEQLTSVGEKNLHIDSIEIPSRKEATLAAIDAALDYLIKNKK